MLPKGTSGVPCCYVAHRVSPPVERCDDHSSRRTLHICNNIYADFVSISVQTARKYLYTTYPAKAFIFPLLRQAPSTITNIVSDIVNLGQIVLKHGDEWVDPCTAINVNLGQFPLTQGVHFLKYLALDTNDIFHPEGEQRSGHKIN